ncbi:MAG: hypothetical protein GOMPHAMPRED_004939 [Gomphillus americanus]|uniref:Biogenesis of lysosome-related organelles complex 1 subunit CNL1 n=1 Tax=Gomphillus americanus TaxID=1940652 RepID=A0A8H3I838_9LECA|nr:MAG: hypothetical protein GOMPHAMPRED_004939 [Gomphillus americanus]
MSSSNRAVAVIADTSLGLSPDELATFRAHGARVLGTSVASSRASITSAATRGRGASRSSIASSSRAGSAASSHHGGGMSGRLMLDAGQLSQLGVYFERLMGSIQDRVDYLALQTTQSATSQSMRAANSIANADTEIARFKKIMREIDELETEFDKVRHIRDIVKLQRSRVESISNKFDNKYGRR